MSGFHFWCWFDGVVLCALTSLAIALIKKIKMDALLLYKRCSKNSEIYLVSLSRDIFYHDNGANISMLYCFVQ